MKILRRLGVIGLGGLALLVVLTRHWRSARAPGASARTLAATAAGTPWQVEVTFELAGDRHPASDYTGFSIVLRDARGRGVETSDVRFELDGVPLEYTVYTGNYYDRHPIHRLARDAKFRFQPGTEYSLSLRLSNGPPTVFAAFETPAAWSATNFQVPTSHPRDRGLVVAWKGLSQPTEVLIYRTKTSPDGHGNVTIEAGGPYAEDVLRHRIGPGGLPLGEGRFTIPAGYFVAPAGKEITGVTLQITTTLAGRFQQPLLEGSTITAVRRVTLSVDIVAP